MGLGTAGAGLLAMKGGSKEGIQGGLTCALSEVCRRALSARGLHPKPGTATGLRMERATCG